MLEKFYLLFQLLPPLIAAPLFLPFDTDPSLMGPILERFMVLWGLLGAWWLTRYFSLRLFKPAPTKLDRIVDRTVTALCALLVLGGLELLRIRTSPGALAVMLGGLLVGGLHSYSPLRIPDPWRAIPIRTATYFLSILCISALTSYFLANSWLWESWVFFIGSSAVLTTGWLASQLPQLAQSPSADNPRYRQRLVRAIHVGMALGPTCIMGLTANYTLPRSYLLLIALVYFLVRTYHRLQPFEERGELAPSVARELQAGSALFVVLLIVLKLLSVKPA